MARVYISSTFKDLEGCRGAVYETLQKLHHDVVAMEDYVAADQRPVDKCLADVQACDIYVGVFAWRYGYVPAAANPNHFSVTELEYRQAVASKKPRLIFILNDKAPWSPGDMDSMTGDGDGGKRIYDLRMDLSKDRMVSYFSTCEQLATAVSVAVTNQLEQQAAMASAMVNADQSLPALGMYDLGLSLTLSILAVIDQVLAGAIHSQVLQIDLRSGDYWWSTRLYLVAALAIDFTQFEQVVFLEGPDADKTFVGMATLLATQRAMAELHPEVDVIYRTAWMNAVKQTQGLKDRAKLLVDQFAASMHNEKAIRIVTSSADVRKWFGADLSTTSIDSPGTPVTPALIKEILAQSSSFVALTVAGRLVTIVDRVALAGRIAEAALEQLPASD